MSGTTGTIAPQRRQLLARSSATDTTITVAGADHRSAVGR